MNEPAINPYQAPSSQSLSAEVPKALGISQVELISYSTVALIQCVVATGLHTLWMKNPKSNMAKVLDDPWDWVVAGVAYCLLFIFLNLCVVKMRRVREGDHPGIDNYLRLAVRLLVLMVAAVFAIFGFAMALGSPQAAYFMWSLSGLTLLSLPWNWTRSSSTS
ncbi:MAG: hypothetical protein NTY42_24295 [Planctomycetota bacterium]|jgi:hypothetical protein|nr:hypothetical protein [Planctomycetota bacterium]